MSAFYTQYYTYPTHSVNCTIKSRILNMVVNGVGLSLVSADFIYKKRGTSATTTVACSFSGADVTLPAFTAAQTLAIGPGTFDFYLHTVETTTLLARDYLAGSFTLAPAI